MTNMSQTGATATVKHEGHGPWPGPQVHHG